LVPTNDFTGTKIWYHPTYNFATTQGPLKGPNIIIPLVTIKCHFGHPHGPKE
jgi:hypothetical protein